MAKTMSGMDQGDGYLISDDCDDTDAAVNPGATEIPYNGKNDDCDSDTVDDNDGDSGGGGCLIDTLRYF